MLTAIKKTTIKTSDVHKLYYLWFVFEHTCNLRNKSWYGEAVKFDLDKWAKFYDACIEVLESFNDDFMRNTITDELAGVYDSINEMFTLSNEFENFNDVYDALEFKELAFLIYETLDGLKEEYLDNFKSYVGRDVVSEYTGNTYTLSNYYNGLYDVILETGETVRGVKLEIYSDLGQLKCK